MNTYEAIMAAADHIEKHPDRYDFFQGLVGPESQYVAGVTGCCALARIGQFLGMEKYTSHGEVAEALGLTAAFDFYLSIHSIMGPKPMFDAADAMQDKGRMPAALRTYAQRFKPPMPKIPESVRSIFETETCSLA
jgi:hypothetical protein